MGGDQQREDEAALLMLMCGGGLPVVIAFLSAMFDGVRTWLIDKGILLEPEQSLWVLPGLDAGLDLFRIVLVVAFLGLVVLAPALLARTRRAER